MRRSAHQGGAPAPRWGRGTVDQRESPAPETHHVVPIRKPWFSRCRASALLQQGNMSGRILQGAPSQPARSSRRESAKALTGTRRTSAIRLATSGDSPRRPASTLARWGCVIPVSRAKAFRPRPSFNRSARNASALTCMGVDLTTSNGICAPSAALDAVTCCLLE